LKRLDASAAWPVLLRGEPPPPPPPLPPLLRLLLLLLAPRLPPAAARPVAEAGTGLLLPPGPLPQLSRAARLCPGDSACADDANDAGRPVQAEPTLLRRRADRSLPHAKLRCPKPAVPAAPVEPEGKQPLK
jgi:hypothetical protein